MATCDACGKNENMPYHCRHCGGTYCGEHRLPESHDCPGLDDWNDPSGVFDSGFDDGVDNRGTRSSGGLSGLLDTGTGGPLGYFRGNMAYVFLGLMFLTYAAELVVYYPLSDPSLFATLFVLRSNHIEYVWTWVTSIFAHSQVQFTHILFNAIVLYFFGPPVERVIGSKRFSALFLASGVVAGLAQVGVVAVGLVSVPGGVTGVLGASGAIMAVLAVLTVLNPDLTVRLYFFIPIPIWVLTGGYALLSVVGVLGGPSLAGADVANLAHLAGLVIGYLYGQRIKREGLGKPNLQFGGRGGGGMGGPGRGRGPF